MILRTSYKSVLTPLQNFQFILAGIKSFFGLQELHNIVSTFLEGIQYDEKLHKINMEKLALLLFLFDFDPYVKKKGGSISFFSDLAQFTNPELKESLVTIAMKNLRLHIEK